MTAAPAIAVPAADLATLPVPMVSVWPGRSVPANSFAARLYRARLRAGWSINTVSDLTGIDAMRLTRLQDNAALPTSAEVDAITRRLDLYR